MPKNFVITIVGTNELPEIDEIENQQVSETWKGPIVIAKCRSCPPKLIATDPRNTSPEESPDMLALRYIWVLAFFDEAEADAWVDNNRATLLRGRVVFGAHCIRPIPMEN